MNLKRFGVLGWPVAHSRSPQIHHAAYEALGLDGWRYQKLPVPPDLFEETVRALPAAGSARTVSANSSGGTGRRW